MYKGGKLSKAARARLEKQYAKERAKDSILAKIDSQQAKRTNRKQQIKTQNKIEKQTKSAPVSKPVEKKPVEPAVVEDDESECPSTPPRNDMVRERNAVMSQNGDVNWISFVEQVQAEAEAEDNLYNSLERKSQQAFKKSLDDQCVIREQMREKEREMMRKEMGEEKGKFRKFDAEEAQKAAVRHAKVEQLKKMRVEQIALLNKARLQYAKKELRRDRRTHKKNQEEKAAHEKELLDKKKAHYAMMQNVLVENSAHKKVVEEQQHREAEEDIRLQKMYAKMLDDQEKARSDRLAKTYAQAEKKVANLMDCTAKEQRLEEEADRLIVEERKRRQAEDDERQRLKDERLHQENLEVQEYLRNQIRRREEERRKEREEDGKVGRQLAEQAKQALKAEEMKVQNRKQKLLDSAAFIRQQIKDNEERRIQGRADMNENEKHINSSLIKKIEAGEVDVREPKDDPMRPFAWRYNYRSKPF